LTKDFFQNIINGNKCKKKVTTLKYQRSKLIQIARKMPPLYHTIPGKQFDIQKSEVIQWLINQPEILNWMWNNVKQSKDVVFNPESGTWQGADFEDD